MALGIIEGIAESTAAFLKLASGFLSDRVHRRKGWVVGGYLLSNMARPLIGLTTTRIGVLLLRFVDRMGKGIRTSPRDALIAESTPAAYHGKAFGFHRAADHAGAVVGPFLATLLLAFFVTDLRTVFLFSLIPGLLAISFLVFGIRENPKDDPHTPQHGPLKPLQVWQEMPQTLRLFVLIVFLFTLGNSSDAFLLLKAQALGVPVAFIPLLWIVIHLVKMGSSYVAGTLSDRWGRKGMILAGWGVYALTYGAFCVADAPWQVWILFTIYGLYFGLTEGVEKALVADLAPSHLRGSAFGLYHLMVGLAAFPASLLFGWIWKEIGDGAAFGTGASLALAASLLLWRLPLTSPERSRKL
jgi:MFS family permease